ncbi:MAG: sulfotransferase [Gammaproteobacteria bacterium]|nr:sulfotransferase [Gammaproteobacteria bacterium]
MIKQPSKKDKINFQNAMNELNGGNPENSLKLFAKVRKSWCENADIFYLEGLAYGKLGRMNDVKRVSNKALKIVPGHFGAMCNLANALITLGDPATALEYYEKALEINPNAGEIFNNYGRALSLIGRRDESIDIFLKALNADENHAPTHASLGKVYVESGQIENAKNEFNTALELDPNLAEAHIGKGIVVCGAGLLDEAERHFNKAIELDKSSIEPYVGLANVKRFTAEYDIGLDFLAKAEKLSPEHTTILSLKAHLLEQKGDKEGAYEIINKLLDTGQITAQAIAVFSRLCRIYDRCDEAIELINSTIDRIEVSSSDKQALLFAAGDLLDKLKRYDESMTYYKRANLLLDLKCNKKRYQEIYDDISSSFTESNFSKYPRSNKKSSRPIFIVGMPRSGTTLTEQILASHSDVYGAGELGYITDINRDIQATSSNVEFFNNASIEKLNDLTEQYLNNISHLNNETRYVVDKMPHNFMHLGSIALLFPEAKIIHCRRHPLDNALSIYFQSFNWAHDYALDLSDLGFFYGFYDKMMQHWENVLDVPILTVQYEDVIDDQESMSRKILDFCDLEWDDAILDFHKNKRDVATASYDQVRQPIYKSSRERWRNYEQYIQPLYDALPEHIKASIDFPASD